MPTDLRPKYVKTTTTEERGLVNLTEKEQKKKKKKGIFPKCVWGEGELKDKDRLDLEMRRGGRENA